MQLDPIKQFRISNCLKAWATLSDEGKMDLVQICFICLDAIYYGYILLYSSYKKKKKNHYRATSCFLFSTGKKRWRHTMKTQQRQQQARLFSTGAFTTCPETLMCMWLVVKLGKLLPRKCSIKLCFTEIWNLLRISSDSTTHWKEKR